MTVLSFIVRNSTNVILWMTLLLLSSFGAFAQQDSTQQIKDRLAKMDSADNRFNNKIDSVQNKLNNIFNPNFKQLGKSIQAKRKAKNDSLQFYKNVEREKRKVQSRFDKAAKNNAPTEKYTTQLDSLSKLKYDPTQPSIAKNKRANAKSLGRSTITKSDSLQNGKLALSTSRLTSVTDSLKQSGPLKEVTDTQNKIIQAEQKLNAPVNKAEGVVNEKLTLMNKEGGTSANLPSNVNTPDATLKTDLSLSGNTQLPQTQVGIENPLGQNTGLSEVKEKIGEVKSVPQEQIGKVKGMDEVKGVQDKLGSANAVTDKAQAYGTDIKNVTQGNLGDVKEAPKALEQQAMKMDEVSGIQKEAGAFDQYKDLAGKGNDPEALKQLAMQQAQTAFKPPVNHFAGKEEMLRTAMDNMSKLKTKYESLDSLKDIPKRKPNVMKGKPFIERLVPGITLQVQKNKDVLIDYNPLIGYRISGRITAGAGWNERFNVAKHFHFTLKDRIYGPRAFVEMKVWKGFSARAELEKMNTYVPSIATGVNDYNHRAWIWSAFVGLKKEYKFWGSVRGNAQFLYNLYDDHDNSPYGDRLVVRMGFEFPMTKKVKAKD